MDFDAYQKFTKTTAVYPPSVGVAYCALGLAGEAGEVANNVKKEIRDGADKKAAVIDELGDVLWYVARLADEYDVDLSAVALLNVQKLRARYKPTQAPEGEDYRPLI
jgi:NTP pyrophosphatase (non-canonical NTP hydrolase)